MLRKVLERLDKTESKIESMERKLQSQSSSSGVSGSECRPTVVRVSDQHSMDFRLCVHVCMCYSPAISCVCVRRVCILACSIENLLIYTFPDHVYVSVVDLESDAGFLLCGHKVFVKGPMSRKM